VNPHGRHRPDLTTGQRDPAHRMTDLDVQWLSRKVIQRAGRFQKFGDAVTMRLLGPSIPFVSATRIGLDSQLSKFGRFTRMSFPPRCYYCFHRIRWPLGVVVFRGSANWHVAHRACIDEKLARPYVHPQRRLAFRPKS
jgi:hypothetical protein